MGIFDSLLGLGTSSTTQKAAGQANGLVNQTDGVTNGLLTNAATAAKGDVTGYGNGALSSLLSGYNQGASDRTNCSGQAQNALTSGIGQAVNTVQGSNAAFQPFASSGTAANGMLSNALGLSGATGNAAATSAFQASPGYQYSVGEWEPIDPAEGQISPYEINGRQWMNGLTWEGVSPKWILTKVTTKTGAEVHFDLTLCPMVMEELARVPLALRTGPIIIDENADTPRPYAEHAYHREWRAVADSAGVPRGLFNMDARAGGATEAGDAGANLGDISPSMGRARPETTVRYIRGQKLETTRRAASARMAHRAKTDREPRSN